jgi:hypothetical protein
MLGLQELYVETLLQVEAVTKLAGVGAQLTTVSSTMAAQLLKKASEVEDLKKKAAELEVELKLPLGVSWQPNMPQYNAALQRLVGSQLFE